MTGETTPSVSMPPYPGNSFRSPRTQAEIPRLRLMPKAGNAFAQQNEAKRLRDQAVRQVIALRAAQDPESTPTPATFVSPAIRHTEVDIPSTIREEPSPSAATTWSAICRPDTIQEDQRNAEARKQLEELQADARARLFQDASVNGEEVSDTASSLFCRLRNRFNSKGRNKPVPAHYDTTANLNTASPSHFMIPSPTPAMTLAPRSRLHATAPAAIITPLTTRHSSGTSLSTTRTDTIPSFRRGNNAMITAQPLRNQFTTPTRFGTYASNGRGQLVIAPSLNSMVGSLSVPKLVEGSVLETTQSGDEELEESVLDMEESDEAEHRLAALEEGMARMERKLDRILAILEE